MTESYRLSDKAILKGDDGLFVVYDAASGRIVELNEIAFEIVSFCQQDRTLSEILRMLKNTFSDTPDDDYLVRDVEALLADCEKNCILHRIQ